MEPPIYPSIYNVWGLGLYAFGSYHQNSDGGLQGADMWLSWMPGTLLMRYRFATSARCIRGDEGKWGRGGIKGSDGVAQLLSCTLLIVTVLK